MTDIIERDCHETGCKAADTESCVCGLVEEMADEIERLREALREVVEAWDWWQEDTYDRCASVPAKAVDAARAALGEGKE